MSEATPLTREPDLWFKDGNLVIQVFPRLFRLHRGVLASHTNFFRDMVQFPESSEQDMYDEVPLVILHDDDARDAVHFFKAIYVFHYFLPPPAKTTFAIIEGVLRLSHKYDAPMLRRCALQHLSVTFVTDLPDMRHDPYRTYLGDDESEELAEFKAVVTLAQEVRATWLLPVAYCYAGMSIGDDGARELFSASSWVDRERKLSQDDFFTCLNGLEGLRKELPVSIFTSHTLGCRRHACLVARLQHISQEDIEGFWCIPLTYYSKWLESEGHEEEDICSVCSAAMLQEYKTWLTGVWGRLPSLFGLPEWEVLLKIKKQDLEGAPASSLLDTQDDNGMDQF